MISLKPALLKRYKDIILLLFRYGGNRLITESDLAKHVDLGSEESLPSDEPGKPEQLAADLESMGPAFIKLGQLLSTRPDFLPPAYLDALSRLQDDAAPVDSQAIRKIISQELGTKLSNIFPEFDDEPLATASLGQVHLAVLRDGRRVAVKVQRPDILESLKTDLEAMTELSNFFQARTEFGKRYQLANLVETLNASLARELNYRTEASNATLLRTHLREFDCLVIPEPIEDLTTTRVLTMEYVCGTKITDLSPLVLVDIDRKMLAGQLFRAYLHQVLIDGLFHADPHPGNLSLTEAGKIVLMDFGMVVQVPPESKGNLIKLLLAIADGQGRQASQIAEQMGQKLEDFDSAQFERLISEVVTTNHNVTLDSLSAGRVIQDIQIAAGECRLQLPRELILLGKTLMNLDRVVAKLDPQFNPNQALRDEATEIMQRHSKNRLSLTSLYHSLLDTAELTQELPARVNQFTRRLAEGDFKFEAKVIDENKLVVGIQKVANRVTAGLITAALIIGASLIMRIETAWTIFGYPGLAFLLLTLASILSAILLWRTLNDQH